MRTAITAALVLAWSMPVVVAAQLWLWMTNYENGVLNYLFTRLHFGNFIQYDWFANTLVGFGVITSLIVWGAIPFVAITRLRRADAGARRAARGGRRSTAPGAFRRFRDITFPILKPIFVILTSLSIIWDFQVFTQPFLLRLQRPDPDYWLMSIYAYEKSFGISEYGLGSAIAIVMLAADDRRDVLLRPPDDPDRRGRVSVTRVAARRTRAEPRRAARVRRDGLPGLLDGRDGVQAGRRDHELHAELDPAPPDARPLHRRDPPPVLLGRRAQQPDRRQRRRRCSRSCSRSSPRSRSPSSASPGRKVFIVLIIVIQMLPANALIIPLYVVLARYHQVNQLSGLIITYLTFVLPFSIWTLRGFIIGIPQELEEAAMVDGNGRVGGVREDPAAARRAGPRRDRRSSRSSRPGTSSSSPTSCSSDQQKQTLTVWLSGFLGTSRGTDWGGLMAGATLTAIPVVIFFLIVQRRIAFGLTAGAVRG